MRGERDAATGEPPVTRGGSDEFRELADFAPVMIWRSGPDKLCDFFNLPWLEFTGRTHEQELGMGWIEGVHPNDYERCVRTYEVAFDAREPFEMDYRLRRHDGVYRWVLDHGRPFERNGAFAGYFGSCIDIDERKHVAETQRILLDELNHRVKNMLASVQAMAHQTFRDEPRAAYTAFCGRLQAMAAAHDTLANPLGWGAELGQLVRRVAQAHAAEGRHYTTAGEPVWVPAKRAVALAISLNELFTNARRHGALTSEAGRVAVDWSVEDGASVRLAWREEGGPPPMPLTRAGVGRRLIEALGREAGGVTHLELAPDGLVCTFRFPLDQPSEAIS
jgi:two-component system, sensor histidine kinase PdtaS